MIAKIQICPTQIRFTAAEALNSFDTLDIADAASLAKSALTDIIEYIDALDRADDTVPIFVVREAGAGIVIKGVGS